jgi:hypothetical protein
MAKPSETYPWATDVGATSDPGPTHKATGYLAGTRLPAKWLNYTLNGVHKWFEYVGNLHAETDFLNKVYAWTGAHSFTGGVDVNSDIRLIGDREITYQSAQTRGRVVPLHAPQNANNMSDWTQSHLGLHCYNLSSTPVVLHMICPPAGCTLVSVTVTASAVATESPLKVVLSLHTPVASNPATVVVPFGSELLHPGGFDTVDLTSDFAPTPITVGMWVIVRVYAGYQSGVLAGSGPNLIDHISYTFTETVATGQL